MHASPRIDTVWRFGEMDLSLRWRTGQRRFRASVTSAHKVRDVRLQVTHSEAVGEQSTDKNKMNSGSNAEKDGQIHN